MASRAMAVKDASSFGNKIGCGACGARYYDFNREDPSCPRCGAKADGAPRARLSIEELIELDEQDSKARLKLADEDLAAVEEIEDDDDLGEMEVDGVEELDEDGEGGGDDEEVEDEE